MRGQAQTLSSARTGSGSDGWQTPLVVLARIREHWTVTLDPCTTIANPVKASEFFAPPQDGIDQDWLHWSGGGLTWANPPYSKMSAWALKMAAEAKKGTPIIALVAARPDTRWWRQMWDVADAVAFWRGRLTFVGAPSPAPFPSALFALNISQRRFRAAFEDVATVVLP